MAPVIVDTGCIVALLDRRERPSGVRRMAMQQPTIDRCCTAAFWLGVAALLCGIASYAAFNATLFQIYLVLTAVTLAMLAGLRFYVRGPLRSTTATVTLSVTLGFLGLAIFLVPLFAVTNAGSLNGQTGRSLKQITTAILQYQDKHGHLPAAAITDFDGKPLLSWRVSILPFLGEEELYRQFNLDEPWDSPRNRGLLKRMPAVYRTPETPLTAPLPNSTYFQALVGPGTAFERGKKLKLAEDFPDGASKTILLVEAATPVPWTAPDDVSYDPKGPLPQFGGVQSGGRFPWFRTEATGFFVALCDGYARKVNRDIREEILRNLIVRNDRGFIPWDW